MKRCLILGVPRSGSTWVAKIICSTLDKHRYYHEPDSHFQYADAARAKIGYGIFPIGTAGFNTDLQRLWSRVYSESSLDCAKKKIFGQKIWNMIPGHWKDLSLSRKKSDLRGSLARIISYNSAETYCKNDGAHYVVSKSVHSAFHAHQLVDCVSPEILVVTARPVEDLAASWLELDYWPISEEWREQILELMSTRTKNYFKMWPTDRVGSVVWTVCAMQSELLYQANKNNWYILDHHKLCGNPEKEFGNFFNSAGINWTETSKKELRKSCIHSSSSYQTSRLLSQEIGKWRKRLPRDLAKRMEASINELKSLGLEHDP